MPGASFSVSFAALGALFHFVNAFDVLVPITRKAIGYSNVPLPSTKCADFTFNEQCTDNWFFLDKQEGINATMVTWGETSSLSLVFQGSAIELYGRVLPSGASFLASVDGQPELLYDTQAEQEEAEVNILLVDQLDPTVTHTFDLRYNPESFSADPDNRIFLGLDFIIVRDAPPSGTVGSTIDANADAVTPAEQSTDPVGATDGKTGTTSLNSNEAPESDDTTEPFRLPKTPNKPLSKTAIAALVSVIGLTIVLAIIALLIYRRRRQRLRKLSSSAPAGDYPFGPEAKAMQDANIAGAAGMGGTLVSSPTTNARSYTGSSSSEPPKRPEVRGSPLYPTMPTAHAYFPHAQ